MMDRRQAILGAVSVAVASAPVLLPAASDPLAALLQAYRDELKAFDALPSGSDEKEDFAWEAFGALGKPRSLPVPTMRKTAMEALRVSQEILSGDASDNLVAAALAFFEGESAQ